MMRAAGREDAADAADAAENHPPGIEGSVASGDAARPAVVVIGEDVSGGAGTEARVPLSPPDSALLTHVYADS
jgi:hypothetical protein